MSKNVIAVKGVPRELYQKVKAAATSLGIPVGKAVTEALELWLSAKADRRVIELKKQLTEYLDNVIENGSSVLKERFFFRIYKQVLAGRKRCIIAHDVVTNAIGKRDPACSMVVRELITGRSNLLISSLSVVLACDELIKGELSDYAEKLILSLPGENLLVLDWKTLVNAINLSKFLSIDFLCSIIIAHAKLYNINTILSSNKTFDRTNLLRVDPLS